MRTIIAMLLTTGIAHSAAAACLPSKPPDRAYYSWRLIEGKRCWYKGPRGKPKSTLTWARATAPASRPPPSPAERLRTCCWP